MFKFLMILKNNKSIKFYVSSGKELGSVVDNLNQQLNNSKFITIRDTSQRYRLVNTSEIITIEDGD